MLKTRRLTHWGPQGGPQTPCLDLLPHQSTPSYTPGRPHTRTIKSRDGRILALEITHTVLKTKVFRIICTKNGSTTGIKGVLSIIMMKIFGLPKQFHSLQNYLKR
jgi:hypothetical protein